MTKILVLFFSLVFASQTWANDTSRIATLCKKQWSGLKAMQSYCFKEKKNYHDWLAEIRKRSHSNPAAVLKLDECKLRYKPDYRRAFDCYWEDFAD